MNHPPLDQLDAHVRALLANVAARPSRRRTMREELLAHLLACYDEECDRGSPAPLDAAFRRLGNPSAQLQSTVPLLERLFFSNPFAKEAAMSRWFWPLVGIALFAIGSSMILPALAMHKQRGVPWSTLAMSLVIAALINLVGVGMFIYGIRRRRRLATPA